MTVLDERPAELEKLIEPEPERSVLRTMSRVGDVPVHWTPGVRVEEDAARAAFDAMKAKGYAAYKVDGEDREIIRRFDPEAGEIVMVPATAGG